MNMIEMEKLYALRSNKSFYHLVTTNPYFPFIYLSFGVCFIIHHVLSPWLCAKYNRVYPSLPWKKRMEWDSRVVSSFHAILVTSLCIYTLLYDEGIWIDPLGYESTPGQIAVSLSMGYFLCDLISMPIYWRGKNLILFIIHHCAAIILIGIMLFYRGCSVFGTYRLVTEASTPFTNQRWFFLTSGLKASRRRVAMSSLIFAILFIITRNGLIIPFWLISYKVFNTEQHLIFKATFPNVDYIWLCIPTVLDLLNLYWSIAVYRIGWKAIKCLYSADWQSDIMRARKRLKKLRSGRSQKRRNSCDSLNTFDASDGVLNYGKRNSRNHSGTNFASIRSTELSTENSDSWDDVLSRLEMEEYIESCRNLDSSETKKDL